MPRLLLFDFINLRLVHNFTLSAQEIFTFRRLLVFTVIVREPVIGLIKWLRLKGLKECSYVEKCAEFKNQTLKKSAGTQKCYVQQNTPGVCNIS